MSILQIKEDESIKTPTISLKDGINWLKLAYNSIMNDYKRSLIFGLIIFAVFIGLSLISNILNSIFAAPDLSGVFQNLFFNGSAGSSIFGVILGLVLFAIIEFLRISVSICVLPGLIKIFKEYILNKDALAIKDLLMSFTTEKLIKAGVLAIIFSVVLLILSLILYLIVFLLYSVHLSFLTVLVGPLGFILLIIMATMMYPFSVIMNTHNLSAKKTVQLIISTVIKNISAVIMYSLILFAALLLIAMLLGFLVYIISFVSVSIAYTLLSIVAIILSILMLTFSIGTLHFMVEDLLKKMEI